MSEFLTVSLLTDNEIDVVSGGRHGGGGGGGGGAAHNNIHVKIIQNAIGGFGGNFTVSGNSFTALNNIGNTSNVSSVTITLI